jgi:nitrate/nitrite transport system substrate-binding protein
MLDSQPNYDEVARRVMRTDIYEEAMKELGVRHGGRNDDPEILFDNVKFDPKNPEPYALGFAVHSART